MEPFSAAFLSTLSGKLAANIAANLTGPLKPQRATDNDRLPGSIE